MTVRRRLVVSGRVQGVGFRVNCARQAQRLGVSGFVRNMPDGAVEVVAEGDPADVAALEAWCRSGPTFARVTSVDAVDQPPEGAATFRVLE